MNEADIITHIHQHEDRLVAAQLAHNIAELDALIHDDLLFHGPGGMVETKTADLAAHRSGLYVIDRLEHLDRQFRVLSENVVLASVPALAEGVLATTRWQAGCGIFGSGSGLKVAGRSWAGAW